MFSSKITVTGCLLVTIFVLVTCNSENPAKTELLLNKNKVELNDTLREIEGNNTNSRTGRTLLLHNRTPALTLRRRQPIQIRARADHLPVRTQIRRAHNGPPNGQPQLQNLHFGFESLKNSKFMTNSKGANLPFPNNGKSSSYRPQMLTGHPNSIHLPALSQQYMHNFKASPAFNGQVKVHPMGQTQHKQQQSPSAAQKDNSYPKYIKSPQPPATAAALPQTQAQKQHNPPKAPINKYPEFKQYPIPDQEKMQQHNEQHEKYLQQQKFLTPKNPIAYYQMQQQQQQHNQPQQHQHQQHQELPVALPQQTYSVQQPHQYLPQAQKHQPSIPIHDGAQAHHKNKNNNNKINNVAFPAGASAPPKMYSVYEENDMTELQTNNYQTAAYQGGGGLDKEAQEYLRFMNSDEYFLPKKEPNYKKLDDEADRRHFNVLKAQAQQHLHSSQQAPAAMPYHQQHPQAQQQKIYHPQLYTPSTSAYSTPYTNSIYSDTSDSSNYNKANPVSRLFYQHDPTGSASDSSTVVRTSYQAGYNQNQFQLNSQEKNIAKHTITPSTTTTSFALPTQAPIAYPQLRHNTAGNRTPEPLRFEFTERDAMVGSFSYTNAPQAQMRYKEFVSNSVTSKVPTVESSTQKNYLNGQQQNVKPIVEDQEDDPEEGDDMQDIGNSLYGRQQVTSSDSKTNKVSSTTEAAPSEQTDTEEYCERICAIVEDENEEIVCGSDGYMYTSEAQMECYASCLHIDITIQGKGSCATR